ncbi:MAG: sulfate adenylyltransferase subunit 1, partial [Achromobacter mucicolens]
DDGKSTLVGRLLYDTKSVLTDQLDAVERVSRDRGLEAADLALLTDQLDAISRAKHKRVAGDGIDFSLLTDGLEAEREQGITIDVAYRYFSTPTRKFIIADAPGHEQYTRNMVTGASTADVAVILIDATRAADGKLLPQTKRHSTIARLLGIRHIVVAVNKMDLVNWDRAVFERIRDAYADLAGKLGIAHFDALPLSALSGDNVVTLSGKTPWYDGQPLLALLESLDLSGDGRALPLRFPVQWVARHGGERADDFRGYAGRLASGVVRPGDAVTVQPSGVTAVVQEVRAFDRTLDEAVAGDSITLVLDRDVDVSRGDVIVHTAAPAQVSREFEAELCWLDAQALNPARKYLLKSGTRLTSAKVRAVLSHRDIHELQEVENTEGTLRMNDIGRVTLTTRESLAVDRYDDVAATGAFILIDEATHQTAAAGMLR